MPEYYLPISRLLTICVLVVGAYIVVTDVIDAVRHPDDRRPQD